MSVYDEGDIIRAMAIAIQHERQRIIALLEKSMAVCAKNQHEDGCDACYGQRDAIALIKGEQK